MSPRTVFGTLAVLVFPAGRKIGGSAEVFLRLMTYDDPRDRDRWRHFDVAVEGRRVGTISNSFGAIGAAGLNVGLSGSSSREAARAVRPS